MAISSSPDVVNNALQESRRLDKKAGSNAKEGGIDWLGNGNGNNGSKNVHSSVAAQRMELIPAPARGVVDIIDIIDEIDDDDEVDDDSKGMQQEILSTSSSSSSMETSSSSSSSSTSASSSSSSSSSKTVTEIVDISSGEDADEDVVEVDADDQEVQFQGNVSASNMSGRYGWAFSLLRNHKQNHSSNSGKMQVLARILQASRALNEPVIVFSQSVRTLDFIQSILESHNASFQTVKKSKTFKKSKKSKTTKTTQTTQTSKTSSTFKNKKIENVVIVSLY